LFEGVDDQMLDDEFVFMEDEDGEDQDDILFGMQNGVF
jgi:hypothetical protein